jgi:coproporphyrinogen III oxidase
MVIIEEHSAKCEWFGGGSDLISVWKREEDDSRMNLEAKETAKCPIRAGLKADCFDG